MEFSTLFFDGFPKLLTDYLSSILSGVLSNSGSKSDSKKFTILGSKQQTIKPELEELEFAKPTLVVFPWALLVLTRLGLYGP